MRIYAIVLALFAIAAPLRAQTTKFTFALPHGLEFTQRIRTVVARSEGKNKAAKDSSESLTRLAVIKTGQGYSIKATLAKATMTRNGQAVNNPALQLMIGRTVTYKVSPKGELQNIVGYEKLITDIQKSFGPEVQKVLIQAMNPKVLRQREEAEWRGRITRFVGKTIRVGDRWKAKDIYTLPTGPITSHSITTFPVIRQKGKRTLVTIRFSSDSDARAALKLAEKALKNIPNVTLPAINQTEKVKLTSYGERVVDARTMFVLSEKLTRITHLPVEVPGQGETIFTRIENKEYRFDITKKGR